MERQILQYSSSTNYFYMEHMVTELPIDITTHIHDAYELFYLISGDLTYYIEGQAYKLYPNDLIITNSRELHRIVFNSKSTYERKYILFKADYISSFQTDEYNMLNYLENRKLGYFNRVSAKDVLDSGINVLWGKYRKGFFRSFSGKPDNDENKFCTNAHWSK